MLDRKELRELLNFARDTIEAAGPIALRYFRIPITVHNKGDRGGFDPVTRADREIELFIRDRINSNYPDHTIVGEEEGMSEGRGNIRWFIDPIDGTRAFISGVPMWGILLGLMDNGECRFGLMHQPYLQETFVGSVMESFIIKGKTAQPLSTRNTKEIKDAILYCTHPSVFESDEDLAVFNSIAKHCQMMRYGGDCYSYCLLAHGFIDLVVEADLKPHDIIPLIPIVESAGGVVTGWDGEIAVNGGKVIASANPELHESVLHLIRTGADG